MPRQGHSLRVVHITLIEVPRLRFMFCRQCALPGRVPAEGKSGYACQPRTNKTSTLLSQADLTVREALDKVQSVMVYQHDGDLGDKVYGLDEKARQWPAASNIQSVTFSLQSQGCLLLV